VRIAAKLEKENDSVFLTLSVFDSGAGVSERELSETRESGLGLNNIEQRLRSYYGKTSNLKIESKKGKGTTAEIKFPISDVSLFTAETQKRRGRN
ncbi:MAG: ATP-binding protein, partial [Pyrinomonadaceae bacterium]